MEQPLQNWSAADFDDGVWQEGPGGFGTEGTPQTKVRTVWNTKNIWIRRVFELPADLPQRIALRIHHDEDADVFCNGTRVAQCAGYTTQYEILEISPAALRPGRNAIAIHCRQTNGGQFIDAGLDAIVVDQSTTTNRILWIDIALAQTRTWNHNVTPAGLVLIDTCVWVPFFASALPKKHRIGLFGSLRSEG